MGDGGFIMISVSRSVGREGDVTVSAGVGTPSDDGDVQWVVEVSVLDAALERSGGGVKSPAVPSSNL
jgi:hypothetical protein